MSPRSFLSAVGSVLSKVFMSNPTSSPDHFLLPDAGHTFPVNSSVLAEKRSSLGTCIVQRATFCKHRDNARHELVVLEVFVPCDGQSGVTTFLQTERTGGEGPKQGGQSSSTASPLGSTTSLATLSNESVRAHDILFIPGRRRSYNMHIQDLRESHNILTTVTFSQVMSVTQLLVVLRVLHDRFPYYSLFKSQCYLYAATLIEVLRKEFSGVSEDEQQTLAGRYKNFQVVQDDQLARAASEILELYHTAWHKEVETQLAAENTRMVSCIIVQQYI
jgi:hypothetical protein